MGRVFQLTGALVGRLTTTETRPTVMLVEMLLLPLVTVAIGLYANAEDPLGVQAGFPWVWLAPVILALRYGPLAGLGGACIVLLCWLALNIGHFAEFPKVFFLGGLILVMLVGEFSSLWQARTRRAETVQMYLDQRLEHLVRQYYLLRLSHDRLEQELIGRPMSMRDALSSLQRLGPSDAPAESAQLLLRLLAQYCQLETATLHAVVDDAAIAQPLAEIGTPRPVQLDDPLVVQALETGKLCHISQALASQRQSQYLIVAPMQDLGGTTYGLLVVHEMPFFSLQEENLQTLNLLLGYYTDGLSVQTLAQPVIERLPECPAEFAFEVQRLAHIGQTTRVPSVIVALEFLPRAVARELPQQILRLKRELDESWLIEGPQRQVLALLMPLGDAATAEGYISRIENWSQQKSGQPLAESGVFAHVIPLPAQAPVEALQRIQDLAHA
ncbi:PelD GGDEF domain-containing protein [Acidovorax lacteus]|uniref:PelD GGDEF domain-containing protein n=2 Tax=Acidovorax lacteus TaxID=1924988 RepID=A0ABP8L0B7_9BURK